MASDLDFLDALQGFASSLRDALANATGEMANEEFQMSNCRNLGIRTSAFGLRRTGAPIDKTDADRRARAIWQPLVGGGAGVYSIAQLFPL